MVKAGDPIPNVELSEGTPDKKINLSEKLASGKGVIVGEPSSPF
jgi:peroxiredoxin 5